MPAPALLDTDTVTRLRSVIMRLHRDLRATPAGRAAQLSPTRISLLLMIDRRGPVRLSEVAEREGMNPTMLSRSITLLVEAGLVERTSDERDRRAAWVRSTPEGHAVAEQMRAERTAALNAALSDLPAAERDVVERAIPALELLVEALQETRS